MSDNLYFLCMSRFFYIENYMKMIVLKPLELTISFCSDLIIPLFVVRAHAPTPQSINQIIYSLYEIVFNHLHNKWNLLNNDLEWLLTSDSLSGSEERFSTIPNMKRDAQKQIKWSPGQQQVNSRSILPLQVNQSINQSHVRRESSRPKDATTLVINLTRNT